MPEKRKLPDEVIEKLIIKAMLEDNQYTAIVSSVFNKEYFNETESE
jgi:AMMECR1 domain-containing protein